MKKITGILLITLLVAGLFAGCGGGTNADTTASDTFDTAKMINVISREDGSGTRGAFIELTGIEEKGTDGTKKDNTTKEATIAMKTDIMLTNVAEDTYAIGYVSLGSMNDSIKAISVDGVIASSDTIKDKTYPIARPFNIAVKTDFSEVTRDFINFILSAEGQEVVAGSYVKIDDAAPAFAGTSPTGKIVIAGSSSVTPVMEKLQEAYLAINPNATIEVQQSDSTSGMEAAMNGTCDIGMASRDLKDNELAVLTAIEIALDGIAVIVNPANPLENLTKEQVKEIYTGVIGVWADL